MAFWDLTKGDNEFKRTKKIMGVKGKIDYLLQKNSLTYYDILEHEHLITSGPLLTRLANHYGLKLVKLKKGETNGIV